MEETWGEVFPHYPTSGSGERYNLPSGVHRLKMDFMHILGQKEATLNTIFSIFERRRAPQTSWGLGKLSLLSPPLDGPGYIHRVRKKNEPIVF